MAAFVDRIYGTLSNFTDYIGQVLQPWRGQRTWRSANKWRPTNNN